MKSVLRAVTRNTSASGMGFAGATGLIASGLTDIASSLGPLLTWFCVLAGVAALVLAYLISRHEKRAKGAQENPPRLRAYCHTLVVLLGSLFGSVVLLFSGLSSGNSEGSNILALLNDIQSGVERVEQQVGEIGDSVEGLGESIIFHDISGRSGTGRIGENAVFEVSLANERLMSGASCQLTLEKEWEDLISVLDDSCRSFTVQLPTSPVLDENGQSLGDIVSIPFTLEVLSSNGETIASHVNRYALHNNYGTIEIILDPPGNRFEINEERDVRVEIGAAELPASVECEWTVFEPVSIATTSENKCVGVLSTAAEPDSYVYKRLVGEGEIRDEIYVQLNSAADFEMLGNATLRFVVRP